MTESEESYRRRFRTNLYEEEIVSALLKVIDNVCNCTLFEIDSDTSFDYDDAEEFSNFEDESTTSENENLDLSSNDTVEAEKPSVRLNFSLDYMKKVIDYYDECDLKGNRKHTWK